MVCRLSKPKDDSVSKATPSLPETLSRSRRATNDSNTSSVRVPTHVVKQGILHRANNSFDRTIRNRITSPTQSAQDSGNSKMRHTPRSGDQPSGGFLKKWCRPLSKRDDEEAVTVTTPSKPYVPRYAARDSMLCVPLQYRSSYDSQWTYRDGMWQPAGYEMVMEENPFEDDSFATLPERAFKQYGPQKGYNSKFVVAEALRQLEGLSTTTDEDPEVCDSSDDSANDSCRGSLDATTIRTPRQRYESRPESLSRPESEEVQEITVALSKAASPYTAAYYRAYGVLPEQREDADRCNSTVSCFSSSSSEASKESTEIWRQHHRRY